MRRTEGSVQQRGRAWYVVVSVEEGGRRVRRWHSGYPTRAAAEKGLRDILGRLERGEYVGPDRQTISVFLDAWMLHHETQVRANTAQTDRHMLAAWVLPHVGEKRLQSLSPADLAALYARLRRSGRRDGRGLSPKSVQNIHRVMHRALEDAVRWGLIPRNPAASARPSAKPQHREMAVWTAAEMRRFLQHIAEDRLAALWTVAATTGMRRSELLGLTWRQVDLEAARLSVVRAAVEVGSQVVYADPKTARSRRQIALDPQTVKVLRAWRRRQAENRLAYGAGWASGDSVFTREDGVPVRPAWVSRRFDTLAAEVGLPRIRFHDLRHSHATLALQAGVHPKVVADRLGHSSVKMTMDVYSHAIPALQEDAADRVAALVFGA